MSPIRAINNIGLLNYALFTSERSSPITSKIIRATLPILYLCVAANKFITLSTRAIYDIGKNLLTFPIATLQYYLGLNLIPVPKDAVELIKSLNSIRIYAIVACLILFPTFITLSQLATGVALLSIPILEGIALGALMGLLVYLEIELAWNLVFFIGLSIEDLKEQRIFSKIMDLLSLLLHAPLSPFLSHDYMARIGHVMPKIDTYKDLRSIMDKKTCEELRNFFLHTDFLNKTLEDIDISVFYPGIEERLEDIFGEEPWKQFLLKHEKLLKPAVNANLFYLLYILPVLENCFTQNRPIKNYIDRKLLLENKQDLTKFMKNNLRDPANQFLNGLYKARRVMKLTTDDLKTIISINIDDLNFMFSEAQFPLQQTYEPNFVCNYLGLQNLKRRVSNPPLEQSDLIKNFLYIKIKFSDFIFIVINTFTEMAPFIHRDIIPNLKTLALVRPNLFEQTINFLIHQSPELKNEFKNLWKTLSSKEAILGGTSGVVPVGSFDLNFIYQPVPKTI